MTLIKKYIPLSLCFIFGMLTLGAYYVPTRAAIDFTETMNKWENIVLGFAFLLGLFSLFYSHYNKIKRKADGWGYSLFVYIGFLIMVVPALYSHGKQMEGASLTGLGWSYRFVYNALTGTMFSVLAFYIVSTAYRSFRIKSMQAGVLLASALILILGKVPLGQTLWDSLLGWTHVGISQIVQWIMNVPVVSGRRGIMIGIAIGGIVTGLKIIFGIERQYMGKD